MSVIPKAEARSLGLKLIMVGALAFLLWVPAMLIYALVWDRSSRANEVTKDIIELAGGAHTVSGPIILVPAHVDSGRTNKEGDPIVNSELVAFTPKSLEITATARTSKRNRSIYQTSVYDADIVLSGRFDPKATPQAAKILTLRWDEAVIAIKFASSDHVKGVRDQIAVAYNGKPAIANFENGIALSGSDGSDFQPGLSAPLTANDPHSGFDFEITLPLSGGGSLFFAPVGENTIARLSADWPDPGFQGDYLPDTREISDQGFEAEWRVPYLARPIPRSFIVGDSLRLLDASSFGVELLAATSPYTSVNRALKYALMFLGLVFLTFFLFEATMGGRAHPAQYILLGATQVLFYLLVLAFAEHIGFDPAFFLTAGATVALSGWYAATVFHSAMRGLMALAAFSGAYGLIYLLMKSEDYALLIGSVAGFGALGVTMVATRHLDWYGARKTDKQPGDADNATPA